MSSGTGTISEVGGQSRIPGRYKQNEFGQYIFGDLTSSVSPFRVGVLKPVFSFAVLGVAAGEVIASRELRVP